MRASCSSCWGNVSCWACIAILTSTAFWVTLIVTEGITIITGIADKCASWISKLFAMRNDSICAWTVCYINISNNAIISTQNISSLTITSCTIRSSLWFKVPSLTLVAITCYTVIIFTLSSLIPVSCFTLRTNYWILSKVKN